MFCFILISLYLSRYPFTSWRCETLLTAVSLTP